MSLAQIFESSLYRQREKQKCIEAFLAETESVTKSGNTKFYDAQYASAKYAKLTAAKKLILAYHEDADVQACIIAAAKKLWKHPVHRRNAFELCRLPEALKGADLNGNFLKATYRQIHSWAVSADLSGGGIKAAIEGLVPFMKYDLTKEWAEKRAAFVMNNHFHRNPLGIADMVERYDLQGLKLDMASLPVSPVRSGLTVTLRGVNLV